MADRHADTDDFRTRLASAAVWRVRLTEAGLESSAEFEAWLAEDPANDAAWRRVCTPWDLLSEHATSPEVMAARSRALGRNSMAPGTANRSAASSTRRIAWSSGLAAALIVAFAGWWLFIRPVEYDTRLGERRVVTLEDGSKISLDSGTAVQVRYSADARRLKLIHGQARFDVAHNADRPFSVDAGDRRVTATGTSFNIDLQDSQVVVTLIEGHVVVTSRDTPLEISPAQAPPPAEVSLAAGQTLTAHTESRQPPQIETASLGTVTAWENGRLIFNDEPLAAVVARVGRYSDRPILVGDQRAAQLRISGVFNAGDVDTFVDTVSRYLPVRADSRADGAIVLSSLP